MNDISKLFSFLSPKQKRTALILFVMALVATFLEAISIGFIIPLVALMTNQNILENYPFLEPIISLLGQSKQEGIFLGMLGMFVFLMFLKMVYMIVFTWYQNGFLGEVKATISNNLYAAYLAQPWPFYFKRNSSELIQNTINETQNLVQYGFVPTLDLVRDLLLIISLTALLLYAEPLSTLAGILFLVPCSWLIQKLSQSSANRWGKERQRHEILRLQWLKQGLESVKEVKLLGHEDFFVDKFRKHMNRLVRIQQLQGVVRKISSNSLEFMATASLSLIIVILIYLGNNLASLFPILAVYAAATLRLLPSVNSVLGSIHGLRFVSPIINTLHIELNELEKPDNIQELKTLPFTSQIELKNVTYKYNTKDRNVLSDLSLVIPAKSFVGIIGESGAGKSTLVDIILGLLKPNIGHVVVDGVDIESNKRGWFMQVGYVPQKISLIDDSLRRNIALGLPDDKIDDQAVLKAVNLARLDAFVNKLPAGIETVVGEQGVSISGGERQRIGIARSLYRDPEVLIFDEATRSLDPGTKTSVINSINALKNLKTIIVISHTAEDLADCDAVYLLEDTKIKSAVVAV